MMRFKCNATVGVCPIEFLVDAETGTDAGTIGRAYMLTQGMPNYVWGGVTLCDTAAPLGAKPGVARHAPKADFKPRPHQEAVVEEVRARGQAWAYSMLYGGVPCASFAGIESRVLAYMAANEGADFHELRALRDGVSREEAKRRNFIDLYTPLNREPTEEIQPVKNAAQPQHAQGVAACWTDGRGWVNIYMREDGAVQAGGTYTSSAGAKAIADKNGNGYRAVQVLITWDPKKGGPDRGKLYPNGEGGWCDINGRDKPVKPFHSEECRWTPPDVKAQPPGTKFVQESSWVGTDGVERTVTARVIEPVQYASWNGLTHGEQKHFKNRLVSWAGLQSAAEGKGCSLCVNDYGHDGGSDHITMSVSSPRWENCLNRLKAWLTESGIPYTKPSTSTVKVKWSVIAPYLTPL